MDGDYWRIVLRNSVHLENKRNGFIAQADVTVSDATVSVVPGRQGDEVLTVLIRR